MAKISDNNFNFPSNAKLIPVIPLRDLVVYPNMVVPLVVGRPMSIAAVDYAMREAKEVLLVAQQSANIESPVGADLYSVGTLASLVQTLTLPNESRKILAEGKYRAKIKKFVVIEGAIFADKDDVEIGSTFHDQDDQENLDELMRSAFLLFERYIKLNKQIPAELLNLLATTHDENSLVDIIAANLRLKLDEQQKILEEYNLTKRFKLVIEALSKEIDIIQVEKRIQSNTEKEIKKHNREYWLSEQMKSIQKELGGANAFSDFEELAKKIKQAGMSQDAKQKAETELSKLRMMPPMSAEATVSRNYLDCLLSLPWKKATKLNSDLMQAEKILHDHHDGLDEVKQRILEYLAVQNRVKKIKGPILCLVGPPGVGKTSLGKAIAEATGRKFTRMSLGGVRDEAEIRGHRRTYIGSLPGKIVTNLSKVGVNNPLFLLDEIDKMAMDFRGDPASALLEVLDPEQNSSFNDHYLEVDYDLSNVMFVTTANTLDIPPALLDRMEVIRLSGYTEDEKMSIANSHLLAKQMTDNGLKNAEIEFSDDALREIIRYYTREAGVRNLEREIAKVCRKVVKKILLSKAGIASGNANKTENQKTKRILIDEKNINEYLGVRKFRFGHAEQQNRVGQVTGLAWTEVGGELLTIEVAIMPGKGESIITGQLGDVMQESVQAAKTVVRSRAVALGIPHEMFEKNDTHVHVPEGAIPKDGPSAGIAMCTALASALTGIPVKADVAMTGEITLRGEVLPIGGLKEKLLAARLGGIKHVIISTENEKDLQEIPDNIKQGLHIHPVQWIEQVFDLALESVPQPLVIEENISINCPVTVDKNCGVSV